MSRDMSDVSPGTYVLRPDTPSSTPGTPATAGFSRFGALSGRGDSGYAGGDNGPDVPKLLVAARISGTKPAAGSVGPAVRRRPPDDAFAHHQRMLRAPRDVPASACGERFTTSIHRARRRHGRGIVLLRSARAEPSLTVPGEEAGKRVRLFDRVVEGVVGVLARRLELSGKRRLPRLTRSGACRSIAEAIVRVARLRPTRAIPVLNLGVPACATLRVGSRALDDFLAVRGGTARALGPGRSPPREDLRQRVPRRSPG